eukprot:347316-Pyramimonas_sp.AAC.1
MRKRRKEEEGELESNRLLLDPPPLSRLRHGIRLRPLAFTALAPACSLSSPGCYGALALKCA